MAVSIAGHIVAQMVLQQLQCLFIVLARGLKDRQGPELEAWVQTGTMANGSETKGSGLKVTDKPGAGGQEAGSWTGARNEE